MNTNNEISGILSLVLIGLIILLFGLIIVYVVLKLRNRAKEQIRNEKQGIVKEEINEKKERKIKNTKTSILYNKKSIFDFMEFDDVKDNMIIQENGRKFLAVIECIGVNYDLMSKMEKNAVEEGFQQFLNTLRHPIQIYIQTRTMNLEKSIIAYKERLKFVEDRYNKSKREYDRMNESMAYDEEDMNKQKYELTRNRNLLEYGKDIIANTERMSLNKNVLTKKYYIIIPYYPEDVEKYDFEEIKGMAFSELYTKAQAIISTLSACSVGGKMLDSSEIIELLYMAYNREEADTYGVEKAIKADYDCLYSTAPDVFEKRIKILDEVIKEKAIELANGKIEQAKSRIQEKAEEKEADMDYLVKRMAEIVLNDNRKYVGNNIAEEAINILREEGGKGNVGQEKKTTRRRKQQ